MRTLSFFAMLVLLCLGLISCEKEAIGPFNNADDIDVAFRSVPSVPFKGVYTTFPAPIAADENGTLTFEIPSEGKATHLGKSSWYSISEVLNTEIEAPPWVQTGSSIFTAANGDQLIGHFEGMTGPTDDYPFVGSGTYYITEGTGRFEGATGQGEYSYFVRPEDFTGQLTFTGILNRP